MQDAVEVYLLFEEDPLASGAGRLLPLLSLLHTIHPSLAAGTVLVGDGAVPWSPAAVQAALEADEGDALWMSGADPRLTYRWETDYRTDGSVLQATIPADWFTGARTERLVEGLLGLLSAITPLRGWVHPAADCRLGTDPTTTAPELTDDIHEVYWLTVLGPWQARAMPKRPGALTAQTYVLPNDTAVIRTGARPTTATDPAARAAQARVLAALTDPSAEGEILARLTARSTTLAPVARDWDPDLAPLLDRILRFTALDAQGARTAAFNKLRPPDDLAVVPASAAPEPDAAAPEIVHRRIRDLAARFVAGMHARIRDIDADPPASLVAVDHHFWAHDHSSQPAEKLEQAFIPGLGAFVGEKLARHLGGRWILRENIEESVVVIGDQAYQPFLRARALFASPGAVLGASVSRFYAQAQRSRGE